MKGRPRPTLGEGVYKWSVHLRLPLLPLSTFLSGAGARSPGPGSAAGERRCPRKDKSSWRPNRLSSRTRPPRDATGKLREVPKGDTDRERTGERNGWEGTCPNNSPLPKSLGRYEPHLTKLKEAPGGGGWVYSSNSGGRRPLLAYVTLILDTSNCAKFRLGLTLCRVESSLLPDPATFVPQCARTRTGSVHLHTRLDPFPGPSAL